ncbi:MAG: DUF721 domain-containing protein [Candidatus Caldatribacteriota bacterium]|nr:DUF721 domain-containing protein [Candidatus Caldatribacteriota bacterium]
MKGKKPIPLKDILEKYLKKNKLDHKVKGYQTIYNWDEVVEKEISRHSHPVKIQGKTLFLGVVSNVWANELNMRKGEIISSINRKAKEEIIIDIRFKIQPASPKS